MRAEQSLALEGRDLRWASVARSLAPIHGVVFANEVLDEELGKYDLEDGDNGARAVRKLGADLAIEGTLG